MDVPIDYFTQRHWDNVAALRGFAPTSCMEALIGSMRDAIGDAKGRDMLDVGCGNGALAIAYATGGARVVGIDLSRRGLNDLRAFVRQRGEEGGAAAPVRLAHMDAQRAGLRSGSFDRITIVKTIWVFPDPLECLREMARILRPSGKLIIQCWQAPDECSLLTTGATILGERIPSLRLPSGVSGAFDFTPSRIAELLRAAGFGEVAFSHHACDFEVHSPAHYWQLFRSLAGSAYYAFASQPAAEQEAISAEWTTRTQHLRSGGRLRLRLCWIVVSASGVEGRIAVREARSKGSAELAPMKEGSI